MTTGPVTRPPGTCTAGRPAPEPRPLLRVRLREANRLSAFNRRSRGEGL
ncbi:MULTISPECIES: hypothetical protein [Streptomyces]|uniref:Uncharacterized protein n=2 Tax=Streptomyces TaxID=1883 RepID=A0A1I6VIX4_9ACTN|nr:hypothetical protein [Streptomyces sp. AA0539]SFT13597.1 hypothetical protein SAMN05444716_108149 [Streptomyces harbinensis]